MMFCKDCKYCNKVQTLKLECYCTNKKILEIQECNDDCLRVNPNSFCEYGKKRDGE